MLLESVFKQADIVALAKVISGNTETYNVAVNKAEELKGVKVLQRERPSTSVQKPSCAETLRFNTVSRNHRIFNITTRSLQLGVLRLGLLQDGNAWVGVFPQREEILVRDAARLLVVSS